MKILSRVLRWLAALVFVGGAIVLIRNAGSRPPKDVSSARGANPLPPCPNTPNCTRESHTYPDADPDVLFRQVLSVLQAMGAESVDAHPSERTVNAAFRVLVFTDDVQIAITREAHGTVLHIRSASRVRGNDLGINRRRVERLLRRIDAVRDGAPA